MSVPQEDEAKEELAMNRLLCEVSSFESSGKTGGRNGRDPGSCGHRE